MRPKFAPSYDHAQNMVVTLGRMNNFRNGILRTTCRPLHLPVWAIVSDYDFIGLFCDMPLGTSELTHSRIIPKDYTRNALGWSSGYLPPRRTSARSSASILLLNEFQCPYRTCSSLFPWRETTHSFSNINCAYRCQLSCPLFFFFFFEWACRSLSSDECLM